MLVLHRINKQYIKRKKEKGRKEGKKENKLESSLVTVGKEILG